MKKITDRINEKKDLDQVSSCLFYLNLYFYAQIPELAETEANRQQLLVVEQEAIRLFSEELATLAPYASEARKLQLGKAGENARKRARLEEILQRTVSNPSPFLRFVSIWVVIQVVVSLGALSFLELIKTLKLDSTIVALVIGTPFAIAAAITAVPFRSGTEQKLP